MAKVERIAELNETEISYGFDCPGCGLHHQALVQAQMPGRPIWTFNGSLDRPTFHPSLKVEGSNAGVPTICHFFVTDGRIQFLGDCTHSMKGKTVELPDIGG